MTRIARVTGAAVLWLSFSAVCLLPLFLALAYPPIRIALDDNWLMTLWLAVCYLAALLPVGRHIFVRRIHELRAAGFFLPGA
jgi:uncharacterized membrane protein YhaH (DUF805 family)